MVAIFSCLNPKIVDGCLPYNMPEIFIKTRDGSRDIIIDWSELSNHDLSTLIFSNYKNTHNGKALFLNFLNGMGLLFTEIYPGLIYDSKSQKNLTRLIWVKTKHVLNYVR